MWPIEMDTPSYPAAAWWESPRVVLMIRAGWGRPRGGWLRSCSRVVVGKSRLNYYYYYCRGGYVVGGGPCRMPRANVQTFAVRRIIIFTHQNSYKSDSSTVPVLSVQYDFHTIVLFIRVKVGGIIPLVS